MPSVQQRSIRKKRQSFWSFCLIAGIWHSCREPKKGIPISDAAKAALQETQKLSGYEKQADDMRENYADRLEILQPVLENESVYDGFKVNADYYIYDKLSEDEVVEKLYEAIY